MKTNTAQFGANSHTSTRRRGGGVLVLSGVLFLLQAGAWAGPSPRDTGVSILTQNMDAGTDLGLVVALGAPDGVDLTLAEIQKGRIPERAELLAQKIAEHQPDIAALEEVTLWRIGATPETTTNVLYDQLELLLTALANHGAGYEVLAVNVQTDLALPGSAGAARYTDRDVVLVRSGLRPPALHFSNVHARHYGASFNFQGLPIVQGYISADVHTGNRKFRLVMTHLESPVPGIQEATDVQVAQTAELIDVLSHLTIPVVVCGDFNSDANFGNFVDATPSVALLEAAGYGDLWKLTHPAEPGNTWPLYLEDQAPPDFYAPSLPVERIDLFFGKGMEVLSLEQVLAPAAAGVMPSFGSDHAGVLATLQPLGADTDD